MAITTIVTVAAVVVSAAATIYSAVSSSQAADAQEEAAEQAAAQQQAQYQQTREDQAPWREEGAAAERKLGELTAAGPGEYEKSPYYDWLQQQGAQNIERGAAARGRQLSGAEQKALGAYGQNVASTDYGNWLDRWYKSLQPWQSLAGLGQTSVQQTGQLGQQAAAQSGNYLTQAGEARAAGILGTGATIGNYGNWLGNQTMNYLNYNKLLQMQNQAYNPYGGMTSPNYLMGYGQQSSPYGYGGLMQNF